MQRLTSDEIIWGCHNALLKQPRYAGTLHLEGDLLWVDVYNRDGELVSLRVPLDLEKWTGSSTGEEFTTAAYWCFEVWLYVDEGLNCSTLEPLPDAPYGSRRVRFGSFHS